MANGYYVGSDLSAIGNNMSRDYATDAQLRAAELQARNQFAAILQQAVQAQANRAQQGDQFNQEMAFRNAALGQNNNQFGSNLDYMREALKAQVMNQVDARRQQGEQFNAEQAYRNAALAQTGMLKGQELSQGQTQFDTNLNYMREALKQQLENQLKLGTMQYSSERNDPRVAAALIEQQGRAARDNAVLGSEIDAFNNNAAARAAQYNALLQGINQNALQKGKEKNKWIPFRDDVNADVQAETARTGLADLIRQLSSDRQGEGVSFDPVKKEFVPILRKAPVGVTGPSQPQNMWSFLLQALKGQGLPAANPGLPQTPISRGTTGSWDSAQQQQFMPGQTVRQNGQLYQFDGTNWNPIVSGQ